MRTADSPSSASRSSGRRANSPVQLSTGARGDEAGPRSSRFPAGPDQGAVPDPSNNFFVKRGMNVLCVDGPARHEQSQETASQPTTTSARRALASTG